MREILAILVSPSSIIFLGQPLLVEIWEQLLHLVIVPIFLPTTLNDEITQSQKTFSVFNIYI